MTSLEGLVPTYVHTKTTTTEAEVVEITCIKPIDNFFKNQASLGSILYLSKILEAKEAKIEVNKVVLNLVILILQTES